MTRKMIDSGIDWIGKIPINWTIHPVYCYFSERKHKNSMGEEQNLLSLSYGNIIRKDIEQLGGLLPESYSTYNIIENGDIVIRPTDLQNDKRSLRTGLAKEHGIITSAYITLKPHSGVYSSYFHYLLHTYDVMKVFYNMGNGVRQSLNYTEFSKLMIFEPPTDEQLKIASFLDDKCSKIDSLIADIQREIEKIECLKRSVVTEVVTKGLDHNVEMCDSGISWIGDIPKHWKLHPIYYYFAERKNKNSLGLETNLLSLSYGKIIRKDINTNGGLLPESFNTYNIVEKDDIIIRPTDLQNDKRSLRTAISNEHGIITSAYIAMKAIKPISSDYFHYLLHSYDVMKVFYNMGNGVRQSLNFSEFSKLIMLEPPIEEQNAIVSYLREKCAEFETIISEKNRQLEVLQKLKRSVIYEYVTGKKEVK